MEELILRRTRAKTPVFRVGQLESQQIDAQLLAQGYQALLPARLMTPFVEEELPEIIPTRTIRKIKRQESLRSLMKKHSREGSISDSETLVGSTPTSPLSSSYPDFLKKYDDPFAKHVMIDEFDSTDDLSLSFDNDMALKMCMELLTKELSSTLAGQPNEQARQSSGLQILLMIESYEKVQQHLRQQMYKSQATGEKDGVQDVERILEYWLKVLYSVYDRSHELSVKGNEQYFPPPLSLSSNRLPPKHPGRKWSSPGVSFGGFEGLGHEIEQVSF